MSTDTTNTAAESQPQTASGAAQAHDDTNNKAQGIIGSSLAGWLTTILAVGLGYATVVLAMLPAITIDTSENLSGILGAIVSFAVFVALVFPWEYMAVDMQKFLSATERKSLSGGYIARGGWRHCLFVALSLSAIWLVEFIGFTIAIFMVMCFI